MIYKNIELFNVEDIKEGSGGTVLYRFPTDVTEQMGMREYNKRIARLTTGIEMRFVGEAFITLRILDWYGFVTVYLGDRQMSVHQVRNNELLTLELGYNDNGYFDTSDAPRGRYAPNVWRIVIGHDIRVRIVEIEPFGEIRPPKDNELPKTTMLAYGSSITHGTGAVMYENAYIYTTAEALGIQVLNKGMGGSCHCEKAVADYIPKADADILYLELGINMLDGFSPEEYREKAGYLLKKAAATGKPTVFVSTLFGSAEVCTDKAKVEKYRAYETVAEELAKETGVNFIKSSEILKDHTELTGDMIHPSIHGHDLMARRLSERLSSILNIPLIKP